MPGTTECVVDILRRCGPGVLSTRQLRAELLRRRPAIALSAEKLRRLAGESEDRLCFLQVKHDGIGEDADTSLLEGWVVLADPGDAPDRPHIARILWESLSALALDLDPSSRVEVCRWAVMAEQARRLGVEGDPWRP